MRSGLRAVINAADRLGLTHAGLAAQRALFSPFVRVVNYHDITTPDEIAGFEAHLRWFAGRFANVDLPGLRDFAAGKPWPHDRPGLVISFDDGLETHRTIVAPLLEKHGFTGWFLVPVGMVDLPASEHAQVARLRRIDYSPCETGGPGAFLDWEGVRDLDRRHVVGCHGQTHIRLGADVPEDRLRDEIVASKQRMEERLGHEVVLFCWIGGEEASYSATGARLVREAGYKLGFMNNNRVFRPGDDPLRIQRLDLKPRQSLAEVRFRLSGAMDLAYTARRRRVERLTAPMPAGVTAR